MMETGRFDRRRLTMAGIAVAAVFFVAVNAFSNAAFRGLSLDFTEGGLFTLSDATRKVLADIPEPITLRYFASPRLGEALPSYGAYAARVRELLERYVTLSNGMIRLEIYAPEPFSDEEDQAVGLGLTGVPVSTEGDTLYFGLAGSNSTDDEEVIPFFHVEREPFLEYDLTRLVANLAHPKKKVVALLSTLPLSGRPMGPLARPGAAQGWLIMDRLRKRFEVRELTPRTDRIGDDVDVLMIVHPKNLSKATLYAIDQYVLGGGKVLAFVDPHAEAQRPAAPMLAVPGETASDLSPLLGAWGVRIAADKVVGDKTAAVRVSVNSRMGGGTQIVDYLPWLSLDESRLNADDVITADLSRLIMATAGAIEKTKDATTKIEPLVTTSTQSTRIDAALVRFMPDPAALWASFKPSGKRLVLAARITGPVKSAFPDGPPKEKGAKDGKNEETKGAKAAEPGGSHLAASKGPINIVLVADTDLLRDQFWVQVRDFFGQRIAVRTSGNADFVLNALDNLSGSNDLIGLRSRGVSARPFTLVRRIQQDAEERYRRREQELEQKLSETEKKLNELQQGKEGDSQFILSPEQEKAIDDFRAEMVTIRRDLRNVKLALRRDIDRLDAWLKFINIALIPLFIALAAVVLGIVRRARRRRAHRPA